MIKQGILNADLRSLTARIGHRDRLRLWMQATIYR